MKIAVVVPNWNGEEFLRDCIDSVLHQSGQPTLVVVDNGSVDGSADLLRSYGEAIQVIWHDENKGFSGGVNAGIRWALERDYDAVALLNSDAIAQPDWLAALERAMDSEQIGITTSLILSHEGTTVDTSGDELSTWGLPAPRDRGRAVAEVNTSTDEFVFGACGGASLYRAAMLRDIGLFDEDFFAYYEDVDLSFRAQLCGWKIRYTPQARVLHRIGATSSKISGFSTFQMYKNLPLVLHKNLPRGLRWQVYPRFYLAYITFQLYTLVRGEAWPMLRGSFRSLLLTPRKLRARRHIVARQSVSDDYIRSLLTTELPEGYVKLRKVRHLVSALRSTARTRARR